MTIVLTCVGMVDVILLSCTFNICNKSLCFGVLLLGGRPWRPDGSLSQTPTSVTVSLRGDTGAGVGSGPRLEVALGGVGRSCS